jgi:hypothetical protein
LNVLARGFGRDDLNAGGPGAGIRFVALIVVPVKMRVDDEFYGLGSEFLDLFDEGARRRRLGVRINDEDAVAEEDDGGIAIQLVGRLGDSRVDALGHWFDVEEVFSSEARCGKEEEKKEQEPTFQNDDLRCE